MFSLFFLHQYGEAEITALEPDPANADLLRRCISENHREKSWRVLEACAANGPGLVSFQAIAGHGTDSHVVRNSRQEGVLQRPAIDAFEHIKTADIVKIDIEGSEWPILTDARLRERLAPAMVVEYHPRGAPARDPRAAAERLLREAGYRVQFIADQGPGMGMLWAWDAAHAALAEETSQ